jgi:hypothetical protein
MYGRYLLTRIAVFVLIESREPMQVQVPGVVVVVVVVVVAAVVLSIDRSMHTMPVLSDGHIIGVHWVAMTDQTSIFTNVAQMTPSCLGYFHRVNTHPDRPTDRPTDHVATLKNHMQPLHTHHSPVLRHIFPVHRPTVQLDTRSSSRTSGTV